MSIPDQDPVLPFIMRDIEANIAYRAKLLWDAAATNRQNPEAFQDYARKMLRWAGAEAVAKDRQADTDQLSITQAREPLHRIAGPG